MINIFDSARIIRAFDRLKPKSALPRDRNEVAHNCDSLMRLGKFERAAKFYETVLELDPRNVNAWIGKGNSLLNQRKYHEAIWCYDKATELDPKMQSHGIIRANRFKTFSAGALKLYNAMIRP